MSASANERFGSRRKTGANSWEFLYWIDGTFDEAEAHDAAIAAAPTEFNGVPIQGISDFEAVGNGLFFATVAYGTVAFGDADETQTFEFDTSGGTQHITSSIQTQDSFAPTGLTAADHKQSIGVDSEGKNPAGTDITAPQFSFSVKRRIAESDIDSAYIATLYALTGTVNDGSISITIRPGISISFALNELLFLGAKGGPVSSTTWEITFLFAASPNVTSASSSPAISIGDIDVDNKYGWDYLWVQYSAEEDATAKSVASRPRFAYTEQVYHEGDHDNLEIA